MDFPDEWAACVVEDCCNWGGWHDHRQNSSYALVKLPVFSVVFERVFLGKRLIRAPVNMYDYVEVDQPPGLFKHLDLPVWFP